MRRLGRVAWVLVVCAALEPAAASGQNFRFDFRLESETIPDLDATSTIDGADGEEVWFTAVMTLSSIGVPNGGEGAQSWACGFTHGGIEAVSVSVEGTLAAFESDGGIVVDGENASFVVFQIVDPRDNGGRNGVVQAVLPSYQRRVTLPTNSTFDIGRVSYRATIRHPGTIGFLQYEDGVRGLGQPVVNLVTVEGASVFPDLGGREITIGSGVEPETGARCVDGIDNDNDGLLDCADTSCRNADGCGLELCADGVDNDLDGRVDCADSDCRGNEACTEICDDGIDNDADGRTDCDDLDCVFELSCPRPEVCTDELDNDEDGDVDCADADCLRHPACRIPEDCGNGVDDDLDGLTDCEDSECFGLDGCPAPEHCDDLVDNDLDGLIDCDDSDCSALARCRNRERCRDGVDNDVDGLADCDDPDCADDSRCGVREDCENGLDDDKDGLADCDDPGCSTQPPCSSDEDGFDLVLHADGARREVDRGDGGGAGGVTSSRNVVDVAYEGEATLDVITYVVPFPGPQARGAQGWSISVWHNREVLDIIGAPTLQGTDAERLFSGGFEQTETATEDGEARLRGRSQGDGGAAGGAEEEEEDGYVSAVILSFGSPATLDPTVAQSIARATYRLTEAVGIEEAGPALVEFRDGLRGSGQPVPINLTIDGGSIRPIHRIPLEIRRAPLGDAFIRGDLNGDAKVNIADAIWSLNELVRGGPPTPCPAAADANDDLRYDFSDPIFIVQYRFLHGPSPVAPFPACGRELVPSALGCPEESVARCP